MERMNEIMKARVEDDEAFTRFSKLRRSFIQSLDSEMAIVGPVKIGDIVGANGYSHWGKKMIVDRVWTTNTMGRVGVQAIGRVLKKNGTPGVNKAEYFVEVAVAP